MLMSWIELQTYKSRIELDFLFFFPMNYSSIFSLNLENDGLWCLHYHRIYWSRKMGSNRQVWSPKCFFNFKWIFLQGWNICYGIQVIQYAYWKHSKWLQIVGEAKTGDVCGEIAVLCYRPQLFTVRTKRLSQLLRLNRTTFLNIVQSNVGDGTIIMNNLLQVCKPK